MAAALNFESGGNLLEQLRGEDRPVAMCRCRLARTSPGSYGRCKSSIHACTSGVIASVPSTLASLSVDGCQKALYIQKSAGFSITPKLRRRRAVHHHLLGARQSHSLGRQRQGVPHQVDTQFDFAIANTGVGRTNPEVAGRGNASGPARGDALNYADSGLVDLTNGPHQAAAAFRSAPHLHGWRGFCAAAHPADIRTDAEALAFRPDDDRSGFGIVGQRFGQAARRASVPSATSRAATVLLDDAFARRLVRISC